MRLVGAPPTTPRPPSAARRRYHPDLEFEPVRKGAISQIFKGSLATTAGDGRHSQLAMRARAYRTWNVSKRIEFFTRTGVAWYRAAPFRMRRFAAGTAPRAAGTISRSGSSRKTW